MQKARPLSANLCFRELMDNSADSIYFKDRQCRLLRVSRKLVHDLGFSDPRKIIGKTDIDLFGEEFGQKTMRDDLQIMESGEPVVGLVESRPLENGQLNWTLTTKFPIHDASGNVIGLMGITREINELKQNELKLQQQATHDPLTGLPNRYLMNDRLEHLLAGSARNDLIFAILYIDLDTFKSMNDTYGHNFGDALLRSVADRLVKSVRVSDTVARIGGDEFIIILEGLRRAEDVGIAVQKVQGGFSEPFTLEGRQIRMTASIGTSRYPGDGKDAATLLKIADDSMYLSKKAG